MKIWILATILLIVQSCTSPPTKEMNESFTQIEQSTLEDTTPQRSMTLGIGDEITINIWRHSELNRDVKIDMLGNISLPLIGETQAAHLTINKLTKNLSKAYSHYIVNPQVDINPVAITSKKFIVLGEINTPGNYSLASDLGIIDAISAAGGTTKNANTNVLLIRRTGGKAKVFIANLDIDDFLNENLTEEDFTRNIMVANTKIINQDILYIPQKSISNIEEFMRRIDNIIAPILSIQRAFILWPQTIDAINGSNNNVIISN